MLSIEECNITTSSAPSQELTPVNIISLLDTNSKILHLNSSNSQSNNYRPIIDLLKIQESSLPTITHEEIYREVIRCRVIWKLSRRVRNVFLLVRPSTWTLSVRSLLSTLTTKSQRISVAPSVREKMQIHCLWTFEEEVKNRSSAWNHAFRDRTNTTKETTMKVSSVC